MPGPVRAGTPFGRVPWMMRPLPGVKPSTAIFTITATVTNAAGTAVSGVTVTLHDWATNQPVMQTTTNALGVYTFNPPHNGFTYFARGYKAGSPNLMFVTDQLIPAQV